MFIKPTVGRVVWVFPAGTQEGSPPLAGLIAAVHSARHITVGGFTANGNAHCWRDVLFLQDDEPVQSGVDCAWRRRPRT